MSEFGYIELKIEDLGNLLDGTKELIRELRSYHRSEYDDEYFRNLFTERWWKDLDIEDKRYRIVKVKMRKEVEAELKFVIPDDGNDHLNDIAKV